MTPQPPRPIGALGRGLASLIPQREPSGSPSIEIPLAQIRRNPYQPRQRLEQEALEGLAASIAQHGVIQPVLVVETLDGYQLVAGERRVRAAQMAGLERIPAVVRQVADHAQLELALVENLQRADLDPIEEAHAYRQLVDEFGMTQEELGTRFGRARSTIANTLRLLDTDPRVQAAVSEGSVTEGHARALAVLPPERQAELLDIVVSRGLSVRQTEELVRRLRDDALRGPRTATPRTVDPDLERVEEDLRRSLATKVTLARSRRGGRIVIEYYSDEDLGRLYERLIGGSA